MTPLDQAHENLKQDQSHGGAFYDLFLNTLVFIPTHDDPALYGDPRRSLPGETFCPYVVESKGVHYLPIFETYERLVSWSAGHQMSYVQMAAHALIRSSLDPKLHVALNIGTPYQKIFVPDELAWLRSVYEKQKPKEITVPAGTAVQVGAPAKIPDGLEDSLRQCLKRNEEVEAAYLGQVHFHIKGTKPELFLVLKVYEKGKPFLKNIQEDVGVAIRGFLGKGENLTLQVYDGKGISSTVVESVKPFFKRK